MKLVDGDKEIVIERMQVLDVRPGDALLVTVPTADFIPEVQEVTTAYLEKLFPGVRVVIKPTDVSVEIIRNSGDDGR